MKKLLFSSFFVLLLFSACNNNVDSNDDLVIINAKGTIYTDSTKIRGYYLIESESTYLGSSTLFPSNLPDNFKQEGVRVLFSGKLIRCPLGAECVAQEIVLSSIKEL